MPKSCITSNVAFVVGVVLFCLSLGVYVDVLLVLAGAKLFIVFAAFTAATLKFAILGVDLANHDLVAKGFNLIHDDVAHSLELAQHS